MKQYAYPYGRGNTIRLSKRGVFRISNDINRSLGEPTSVAFYMLDNDEHLYMEKSSDKTLSFSVNEVSQVRIVSVVNTFNIPTPCLLVGTIINSKTVQFKIVKQ